MRLATLAAVLAAVSCDMHNSGTPDGVPADVDCTIRELAYEFGRAKLPERGDFGTLYDALQLAQCPGTTAPRDDGALPPGVYEIDGAALYVAADGDDDNAGDSLDKPLKTIAKALALAAAGAAKTIAVRGGTYELAAPLELGPEHSGVTLQNYGGEAAIVSGGVSFTVDNWVPYVQTGLHWQTHYGANNVFGLASASGNTSEAAFVGVFDDAGACGAAARAYLSWTYHEAAFGGPFAKQCFGRVGGAWIPKREPHVVSGRWTYRNTWVADLARVGLDDVPGLRVDGARAIRAKYPDGDPERSGEWLAGASANMGGGDYTFGWIPLSHDTEWVKPARKPDARELVFTGADWPSVEWPASEKGGSSWTGEGDWGEYHLGLGGYCDDLEPPVGYWCAMDPPRGQCWDKATNTGSGCTQTHMSPDGVVFPRAATYANATGAVVQSWRGGGRWFTQQWVVERFDEDSATLVFDPKTGMQGGEGGTDSGQFWIENVLEECDAAREFYYDVVEKKLYWNPNGTMPDAAPTGDETFVATRLRTLVNATGTPDRPVSDVAIRGLSFVDARYTYMDPHGMPSGGDWALQRNGAITLEGVANFTLAGNAFARLDGNAVNVNGYARDVVVDGNDFSWIGDSCIALWGHTGTCLNENCSQSTPHRTGPDGRGGEQPWRTVISRNVAREIGVWQKQSSFLFQAVSYATHVKDNVHFNGPRAGINFNDGFAGGDVLEGNLLANCVRESGDHGPFNSWDRVPYITDFDGRRATVIPRFRQIRDNFVLSVARGARGRARADAGSPPPRRSTRARRPSTTTTAARTTTRRATSSPTAPTASRATSAATTTTTRATSTPGAAPAWARGTRTGSSTTRASRTARTVASTTATWRPSWTWPATTSTRARATSVRPSATRATSSGAPGPTRRPCARWPSASSTSEALLCVPRAPPTLPSLPRRV